ncbi:hypothetical protein F511_29250 [Dorcoceras hygrometricum]|uniref:Uncharacterized protein n=1 Tax=Dorcoceras hygrometricum TaxID=472368 RepID=A0A2Z7CNI0_9LAMI|nr:hypothetical protein F511_29250 [Dorcoceras hygrometricum]
MTIHRVFLGVTFLATRAWLRPVSRVNRHFMVGGGILRQSGPRPEARLLRQPALEGLTRSARTDSPRQVGRNNFRRSKAAAATRETRRRRRLLGEEGGGHLELGSRTPQNPLPLLNTLSSVSVRESRIQYLCDPQWFRDTASRGPTTIVAPESQFRTCPTDHGPRPETRFLRHPALEGVTRSARTDSPRRIGRNKFRRGDGGGARRRRTAVACREERGDGCNGSRVRKSHSPKSSFYAQHIELSIRRPTSGATLRNACPSGGRIARPRRATSVAGATAQRPISKHDNAQPLRPAAPDVVQPSVASALVLARDAR